MTTIDDPHDWDIGVQLEPDDGSRLAVATIGDVGSARSTGHPHEDIRCLPSASGPRP